MLTAMRRRLRLTDPALISWGSNDYLGLSQHPAVLDAAQAALRQYGAGAGASRLVSGHTPLHAKLESILAAYFDQEAALVFPSGYMTNLGVLTTLAGEGDALILDRLCHASLIDAARLSKARLFVYPHRDVAGAEKALKRARDYGRRLLVTESVFSMDGDLAPLAELRSLAREHHATLVVDEAHSLGMQALPVQADVVIGTLSKALGSQGGFVAASHAVVDQLVNHARSFIFTTGLAPACVGAARESIRLIKEGVVSGAPVQRLADTLRQGLQAQGWNTGDSTTQIIPVIVGSAERVMALSERLRQRGHDAPAIRPPTVPEETCRLRLSVTAFHTDHSVQNLLSTIGRAPHE